MNLEVLEKGNLIPGASPNDSVIRVTLSRRNLQVLLAKLDGHPPNSQKTIYRDFPGATLVVIAEENAAHYAEREPGEMHRDSVAAVEENRYSPNDPTVEERRQRDMGEFD